MKTDNPNNQLHSMPLFLQIPPVHSKPENIVRPHLLNNFGFLEFHPAHPTIKNIAFFDTESFYLIYCRNGKLILRNGNKALYMHSHQSSIFLDAKGKGFLLENTDPASHYFIIAFNIPQQNLFDQNLNFFKKLKKTFASCVSGNHYLGGPNLEVLEKIDLLSKISPSDVANQFLLEGYLFQIYGLQMSQILYEKTQKPTLEREFTLREIEQLQAISESIAQNPSKDYTVQYLCAKTGMGPNKLQRGFKKMHNKTVIDYIRHKRLEMALHLMKNTNLTISEIVYSVGLSSRSYFSKIFKKKYKCSPKYYQQELKNQ